jgi:chromosomal replication initiation ATPase DnaA
MYFIYQKSTWGVMPKNKLDIIRYVCQSFHTSLENIQSSSRKNDIVLPRHLLCFALDKNGVKPDEIADIIKRDRTTIYRSCDHISDILTRKVKDYQTLKVEQFLEFYHI